MATSFHKVTNNAASLLATAIDDNDTSIVITTGDGAEFSSALQWLTVGRDASDPDGYAGEIVEISGRSSDTFTAATRGDQSTSATGHDAGELVECLITAEHLTELQDAVNALENGTAWGSGAYTITRDDSGTNNAASLLELYHTSSGTPAAGLGAKLTLGAENSTGSSVGALEVQGYLTTVTASSEAGEYLLRLRYGGALQDAFKVTPGTNKTTLTSGQTSLDLFNTVATAVNAFGVATAISLFANAAGASTCTLFAGAAGNSSFRVGDGSVTQTREIRLSIANAAGNQAQLSFFWGATRKFVIFNTGGTDTLNIYSDTATAAIMTFAPTNIAVGAASTNTFTMTSRLLVRSVTDAGPMTATAGTQREIVFNTSDSKFYGCVTTGSPASWSALN